jgi:antitoxin component of MazEF toxin-antitoxin module
MAVEVQIKKWGNSMGAIFPKLFVESKNIKENEQVIIEVIKKVDLSDIFGSLKRKISGQEFKDMAREGWEK